MVFEDMQWADDSLLDFIDYLLEWSRSHAIFVCTLARPEIHERRPTWGAGQRSFTSLYLEPLSQPAMEQLLDGLVPGLPDELRTQILERAEGVPLYAVETVRMMLDRGALVQDGPVYRPDGHIAPLEVPETLHALIAARLDGLAPEERRVVQDAAVLGKSFPRQALAVLSGVDDGELEPLLRALVRKEILSVQADPRSPEYGQHSFVQDLLRHVAYETLSKQERRARHLAAAAHLESAFADEDEIVEVVASHYLDAYAAAPDAPDAPEIKIKAREMLTRAGDRAASLAAAREAQRYFQQAAELGDDAMTCAELQFRAGEMAWRRGRGDEARGLLDEAQQIFERSGLPHRAARVATRLAHIDFRKGRVGDAVARLERALEMLPTDAAGEDVAEVAAELGRYLILQGHADAAVPHLELALALSEALGLSKIFVEALTSKSLTLMKQSRFLEAEILLQAALDTAAEADLSASAGRTLNNLAVLYESRDRYAEAIATTDRGCEFYRRTGNRVGEQSLLAGSISAFVLTGRWDVAYTRLDQIRSECSAFDFPESLYIVSIACWRGQIEEAKELIQVYADLDSANADLQVRASHALHEAMVARLEGDAHRCLTMIERDLPLSLDELGISFLTTKLMLVEALEAAFELGDTTKVGELLEIIDRHEPGERPPLLEAHAARFRAKLAGSSAPAERDFERALLTLRECELVVWYAVVQLEVGEWLIGQGRADEAEPLLEEARETFERLEATPWVLRAEAAGQPETPAEALA
jgi:tetratricopeptide (TPR) repeat protein